MLNKQVLTQALELNISCECLGTDFIRKFETDKRTSSVHTSNDCGYLFGDDHFVVVAVVVSVIWSGYVNSLGIF